MQVYADAANLRKRDDKLLAIDDWMLLLRHLHFFDDAFQQREGTLCVVFSRLNMHPVHAYARVHPLSCVWHVHGTCGRCFVFSRLRCVDEESERGKRKVLQLSFEDFLEALVRLATLKPLPTRAELEYYTGHRDAHAPRACMHTCAPSRVWHAHCMCTRTGTRATATRASS